MKKQLYLWLSMALLVAGCAQRVPPPEPAGKVEASKQY
jgi:hypothetical protein